MIPPVLVEIPVLNYQIASIEELDRKLQEAIETLDYVPCRQEDLEPESEAGEIEAKPSEKPDRIKKVLWSLRKFPFMSMDERCNREGISPEEMKKLLNKISENGLIINQSFGLGRGQPKTGALLTEAGLKFIGANTNVPGRGSLQARYIVHKLKEEVFKNAYIETDGCDLVAYDPQGLKIAVEVEVSGDDHFVENIRRNLSRGFSKVLVLGVTEKDVKAMRKKAGIDDPRVVFFTVKEVLNASNRPDGNV